MDRDAKGVEVKTDVDVITDADCITMDDGDLRSGVKKMIDDRIGEVIDGAPKELDTLKEIATELDKNQSGVSTIIKAMNDKLEAKDLKDYAKTTEVDDKLKDKVSVVDGKELSTNDFTDVDKQKLDAIEDGAQKNRVNSVNGMTGDVTIKAGGGNIDLSGYAKTSDIKTKLSEMTEDSTHRTVTDEDKTKWNRKLSTVSGQDISRAKAKGYDSASSWQLVSNSRDLEDWIGDFDKRTRELKQLIDKNYDDTTAAPGRKSLRAGNELAGFFGTVSSSQFISGDELARKIGLTAGSSINSDTPWLKFIYLNKIEFIPLKPIRGNVSWDDINSINCVFGSKIINIDGINYKVRLIKGKSEGQQNDSSSSQGSIVLGSEWNKLLFPIHANSVTKNWKSAYNVENNGNIVSWRINYDNNDLGSNNSSGARCWCQELGSSGTTRLCRGYEDISTTSNGVPGDAYADRGWRPCLEVVEE